MWKKRHQFGDFLHYATKVVRVEVETLFTASKWDILQHLSAEPLSPLELAERSATSLANISQQLRLLEMAGLVTSKRISNRDKGQPRIKYSLATDQSYLITAANDFVEKKMLQLSPYNKVTLKIWFYEDPETRYVLEKAFWSIEQHLEKIKVLAVPTVTKDRVNFCGTSDQLKSLPTLTIKTPTGNAVTVDFTFGKNCDKSHVLYEQ